MGAIRSNLKDIYVALGNIIRHIFKDWSIKKAINFSNLLKIIFLYLAVIFWVIVIEFDYSDGFWKKAISGEFSERRLSVYSVQGRIGESLLYKRVLQYAQMNNYDYSGCRFLEELTSHYALTSHFYRMASNLLNYILQPNFNLAVTHHVSVVPDIGYNIMYLNMPSNDLYTPYGEFKKRWGHMNKHDAYADLYSLSNGKNELLEQIILKSGKNKPIIPLYISQLKTEYKELEFNKVLITGSLWGCGRGSLRTMLALKKLAQDDLLDAIGLDVFEYLGEHYKGRMEDYGNIMQSIVEQHQKYGISLVVHNREHMLDGIPTSRISESASSSVIIISDRNKFLEKHFADSVFFIDLDQDVDGIYDQIKEHVNWIKAHPKEALAMTRKAFDIFNDNFTIEEQMEKLFVFMERKDR